MTIITDEMRRAAAREITHPTMAFDKIEPDGSHPLEWILRADQPKMATDNMPFFDRLRQAAMCELQWPSGKYGNDPTTRARIARLLGKDTAVTPYQRIMARDQSFSGASGAPVHSRGTDQSMPPRGSTSPTNFDQDDPNGNPCTAEECLQFVQMLINGFTDPDEKQQFIEGLSNIVTGSGDGTLQITHMPDGNGRNGNGDRRPAKDAVVGKNAGALDRNRRPAQDAAIRSLNSSNFARRWGSTTTAMTIRFGGNGR